MLWYIRQILNLLPRRMTVLHLGSETRKMDTFLFCLLYDSLNTPPLPPFYKTHFPCLKVLVSCIVSRAANARFFLFLPFLFNSKQIISLGWFSFQRSPLHYLLTKEVKHANKTKGTLDYRTKPNSKKKKRERKGKGRRER